MTKPTFEKIDASDALLYGPVKLLLCGFMPPAQSKFKTLLGMLNLSHLPLVWVCTNQMTAALEDLLRLPEGSGEGQASEMPRAIIVSGISQQSLHLLMSACRQAGMTQALWAVLTPISEKWPLQRLLNELAAERAALSKPKKK